MGFIEAEVTGRLGRVRLLVLHDSLLNFELATDIVLNP